MTPLVTSMDAWSRTGRSLAGALCLFLALASACAADFNVSAPGSYYSFNSSGVNPTIILQRGKTYTFQVNTPGHPFRIIAPGMPGSGITSGMLTFNVPTNAVNYSYICTAHGFGGTIQTVAPPPPPNVRILSLAVGSNIVLKSTGASNWSVFPEFKTDLAGTNWFMLTVQSNSFLNGTNETFCGRPPGDTVFVRVRAQQN